MLVQTFNIQTKLMTLKRDCHLLKVDIILHFHQPKLNALCFLFDSNQIKY